MNRISQYFKKLFPSTPKGDLIPQPTKREVILTPNEPKVRRSSKRSRLSNILRARKRMKLKENAPPKICFGGTCTPIRLLPGQKTGMDKFKERMKVT